MIFLFLGLCAFITNTWYKPCIIRGSFTYSWHTLLLLTLVNGAKLLFCFGGYGRKMVGERGKSCQLQNREVPCLRELHEMHFPLENIDVTIRRTKRSFAYCVHRGERIFRCCQITLISQPISYKQLQKVREFAGIVYRNF